MAREIEIDEQITVGALAELLDLPVTKLIGELFKLGVMATVNEKVDFDTATLLLGELELEDVELKKKEKEPTAPRVKRELSKKATTRPPVVAMMGHVDHGKTSLLDAIREKETVKGEAGGITQHLSAYQIKHKDRYVTFIDTPGHEAFAALREHGARLTDVAVLVVAADEGVKPQTIEAIRFAQNAGVKVVVAANKMDKATEAQLNQLKSQLVENQLNPEDFGGDTVVIPVSAKEKTGLEELVDMILLVADVEELKADHAGPAEGIIIESHMETGRGRVAIALVEQGTLKTGDFVSAGSTYGKIRNLEASDGTPLEKAGPSMPVLITGLKDMPDFGEEFQSFKSEKDAKAHAAAFGQAKVESNSGVATSSSELLRVIAKTTTVSEFHVLIKADVQGSLTSVIDSLKSLETEEVTLRIVGSGVGVITESDLHTAASAEATIYGFNVTLPTHLKQLAARDHVPVRIYKVIYELIDDVKNEMEARLAPEIIEELAGRLIVKGIFKTTQSQVIAGGEVTKGKLVVPSLARIFRDKEVLADEVEVTGLKAGPTDVTEVEEGNMCGISLKTSEKLNLKEEDRIEVYTRRTETRKL
jgi:translation initiation factor IF-2